MADLFLCIICKIPSYLEIINSIKFKYEFQLLYDEISSKLIQFKDYFHNLRNDRFFQSFLSFLLSVGNFMNGDTSKGNAYGFRVESIEKTYTVMAQGNKLTLFDYLMQVMEKKGVEFPGKNYGTQQMIAPL